MSEFDETKIPDDALCTNDLDCVLLTDPQAYKPGIVKIAAEEAGLKWKEYKLDIGVKKDQYKAWYLKLNPKAYVPTMLIKGNTPVCESLDIIQYMDKNLNGKNKLMINQPDEIKDRYERFIAVHEKFEVED